MKAENSSKKVINSGAVTLWQKEIKKSLNDIQSYLDGGKDFPNDGDQVLKLFMSWKRSIFDNQKMKNWLKDLKDDRESSKANFKKEGVEKGLEENKQSAEQEKVGIPFSEEEYERVLSQELENMSSNDVKQSMEFFRVYLGNSSWNDMIVWMESLSVKERTILGWMGLATSNPRVENIGGNILNTLLIHQHYKQMHEGTINSRNVASEDPINTKISKRSSAMKVEGMNGVGVNVEVGTSASSLGAWDSWTNTQGYKWELRKKGGAEKKGVLKNIKGATSRKKEDVLKGLISSWMHQMRLGNIPMIDELIQKEMEMQEQGEIGLKRVLKDDQKEVNEQDLDLSAEKIGFNGIETKNTKVQGVGFKTHNIKIFLEIVLVLKNNPYLINGSHGGEFLGFLLNRENEYRKLASCSDERLEEERSKLLVRYISKLNKKEWESIKEDIKVERELWERESANLKANEYKSGEEVEGQQVHIRNKELADRVWRIVEQKHLGFQLLKRFGYAFDLNQIANAILRMSKGAHRSNGLLTYTVMDRCLFMCASANIQKDQISKRMSPIRLLLDERIYEPDYDGLNILDQLQAQKRAGWLSDYSGRPLLELISEYRANWIESDKVVQWLIEQAVGDRDEVVVRSSAHNQEPIREEVLSGFSGNDKGLGNDNEMAFQIKDWELLTQGIKDGHKEKKIRKSPLLHTWFQKIGWYTSRDTMQWVQELDNVIRLLIEKRPDSIFELSAGGASVLRVINNLLPELGSGSKDEKDLNIKRAFLERWFEYFLDHGLHPTDVLIKKEWEESINSDRLKDLIKAREERARIERQLAASNVRKNQRILENLNDLIQQFSGQFDGKVEVSEIRNKVEDGAEQTVGAVMLQKLVWSMRGLLENVRDGKPLDYEKVESIKSMIGNGSGVEGVGVDSVESQGVKRVKLKEELGGDLRLNGHNKIKRRTL